MVSFVIDTGQGFIYFSISIFIKPRDMTIPAETEANSQETFSDKVDLALKAVKRDDSGNLTFAEDTPEEIIYAVTSEYRRRDTQGGYTKGQVEISMLNAKVEELLKHVHSNVPLNLTPEQQSVLDNLKVTDPDKWHDSLNAFKAKAREEHAKLVEEQVETASAEGINTAELQNREEVLAQFKRDNPGFELNDDIIVNLLPAGIPNALDEGKITFFGFLTEARKFLLAGKVVGDGETLPDHLDLGKVGGSDSPSANSLEKAAEQAYEDTIF